MLAAGAATASTSGSGRRRSRDLCETVQNLELSLRLAAAPYQPVDTIADCDERKSRTNDRSWSAIGQTATLVANDHGVLNVEQRAVIVNIGVALANSGFNAASVSLSSQEAAIIQSILNMLFGGSGFPSLNGFTGSTANGSAAISTGSVIAIGNDTTTGIGQSVNGAVSGQGRASASQLAYVTNLGITTGYLLGGAIVVEEVFAIPGLGRLILGAVTERNYPLVQATILMVTIGFVLLNFAIDLIYGLIDPRLRR